MSNAVVGALRVDLGLDSSAFAAGLQNARASLKNVGQSMTQIGTQMSAAVTAPLAGFGALTLKTAGDFEASMNRVQAALGTSEQEFAALREAARDMGATTQFSATEASDAVETLAKNGVSAADILGGALEASLTLAAASGSDLASSADVATDVMANFGKTAEELKGVVDGVSGVLLESKFGFDDYRLAIGQAGGVAGGFGVELEEFNAVIAATSSSFASGSDAGTSFKTFLQRLAPDTKPAIEAMNELGIEFFDAQGNMKSMSEVAQELQDGISGLSEEQRNLKLADMFGQDAIRTAIALAREGAAGIDELTESISQASATEQAEARMQGLNGTLKELKSAFEELQLAIADSGLLDAFVDIVKGAVNLTRAAGELDPKLLKAGVAFGAIAAAVGPLLIPLGLVATGLAAISVPALAVGAAIIGLTAAAVAFSPELSAAKDAILGFGTSIKNTIQNLSAAITDAFGSLPETMAQIGRDILDGLKRGLTEKYQAVKDSITGFVGGLAQGAKDVLGIQSPSKVFRGIGENIMQGLGLGLESTGDQVSATMEGITGSLTQDIRGLFNGVLKEGQSFKDALSNMLGSVGDRLIGGAINSLIPGFANGTDFAPGGLAMVGERGPELVNLPRGSQVIPNHKLPDGGGGATFNIDARGADEAAIARLERNMSKMAADFAPNVLKTINASGRQGIIKNIRRR